jgi:hypothetical protein
VATTVSGSGDGVFDNAVMFMSSGNLTKTGLTPSSGLKIRGTPLNGLGCRIMFPTTPGLSATVLPEIHCSADNSTYRVASTYPGGALSWASGTKEVQWAFTVPPGYPYVKLKFTITGGSTACSYGAVQAGIVLRANEYTRAVRWD